MRSGNYPTPAQVSVFLGEIWLDDAYRIEVRDQNPLIPLYGYGESEYTAVAQGKRIVQGSLIINYRYPEYLRAAIDGQGHKQVDMDRSVALAHALRTAPIEERIALLEDARMSGVGREAKDIFISQFIGAQAQESLAHASPEIREQVMEAQRQASSTGGAIASGMRTDPREDLTLKIYFDTPDRCEYYARVEGVRLVGRAMTISNAANSGGDASSSGQNLFELYPFFARRVTNVKIQSWQVDPVSPAYGTTDRQEILNSLIPTPVREGSES